MTSVSHQGFLGWGGGLGGGGGGYVFCLWLCDMERGGQGKNRPKNGEVASKKLHWKKKLKSP